MRSLPTVVRRGQLTGALGALIAAAPAACLGVVLIALAAPAAPPTAGGIAEPGTYRSLWTIRVGPANLFEVAVVLLAGLWLARAVTRRTGRSAFDVPLAAAAYVAALLQLLALARGLPEPRFLPGDLERIATLAAGYLIVTRCLPPQARPALLFGGLVCAVLVARATELVVVDGLIGSTQFGTATGREALLITEDSLLVLLPAVVAFGALVDGRLRVAGAAGAVTLVVSALAVNALSLRRAAVLIFVAALAARGVRIGRRRLLALGAAAAVAVGVLYAAGPARGPVDGVGYTLRSIAGQASDASTSQRGAELRAFGANVDGVDWLVGRGFGTEWRADHPGPVELGSFGSGETAYIRIGWHVPVLDYAYKLGLLGLAALAGAALLCVRRGRRAWPGAPPRVRGWILSLAIVAPAFALFALTNIRVALATGVVLGLLSRLVDAAAADRAA